MVPGALGDPLRALQIYPSVARPPGGLGLLVIRGASPDQTQTYFGVHSIPHAFHYVGISSTIPSDAIGGVTLLPGNVPARFGNATGGVVLLEPRRSVGSNTHGHAELGLHQASGAISVPVKKGRFVLNARRGLLDAPLSVLANSSNSSVLIPRYFDYLTAFEYPLRAPGTLVVRWFGAGDRLSDSEEVVVNAQTRPRFTMATGFHRLDVELRARAQRWRFLFAPSARLDLYSTSRPSAELSDRRRDVVGLLRSEASYRYARAATLTFGSELSVLQYKTEGGAEVQGTELWGGLYMSLPVQHRGFRVVPEARANVYAIGDRARFVVDPRARVEWSRERWSVFAAAGLASQRFVAADRATASLFSSSYAVNDGVIVISPQLRRYFYPTTSYAPDPATLEVLQATQLSAGARFSDDRISAAITPFLRIQPRYRSVTSPVPDAYEARALGGGAELSVKINASRRLSAWVSYALSAAVLDVRDTPSSKPYRIPADFDQRHNFHAAASYLLPKRWRIGARFRLTSGNPYTPVTGVVYDLDGTIPLFGPPNSARTRSFHQLDVRVEKMWVRSCCTISAYLDIQNIYNYQNPETYIYNSDLSATVANTGLPILPLLGLRVDF